MALIDQVITDRYAAYNGDCIAGMQELPDGKIHMSIYSPPFATPTGGMYHYSSSERDLSNNSDYRACLDHYEFVVRELHRVTLPGRFTCVHCCDIPTGNSGGDKLIDYPGDIIRLHEKNGWTLKARHMIWKEPLWVRNRTMSKDLAHKTIVDDSALGGVASVDQLLILQRSGKNTIPIEHPTGFDYYAGECPMPADILHLKNFTGDQKKNSFSHWIWRRYASGIWDDIRMGRVLPYRDCKEPDDEKHVHPLQLDIIDRAMQMRSNPGETVLTPFMGVGSEVYGAVTAGRRGIGFELKTAYYRQALANLESAANGIPIEQPAMSFDELEMSAELEAVA